MKKGSKQSKQTKPKKVKINSFFLERKSHKLHRWKTLYLSNLFVMKNKQKAELLLQIFNFFQAQNCSKRCY
jgi:hypothetical protein